MDLTVVVDPVGQQGQDCVDVWEDDSRGIVPFEGFDEGLGHAVTLRASNRGEEQIDPEGSGNLRGLPGDIGAAIVREPFQSVWDFQGLEAAFDRRDHEVTHHFAGDAGIGHSGPCDDLAVAGIDDKHDADDLTIAGVDLQMI